MLRRGSRIEMAWRSRCRERVILIDRHKEFESATLLFLDGFEIGFLHKNTCGNFALQDDPVADLAIGQILYLIDFIDVDGSEQSNPIT